MSFRAAVVSGLAAVAVAGNVHDRSYYQAKFYDWLAAHKVNIENGEQFVHFLQNFANNEDLINAHNSQPNVSYTLGHNQFSHMNQDEWRQYVKLGLSRPVSEPASEIFDAPSGYQEQAGGVDWTSEGAVTPVKDQGQCGSCWAFSATGAMEGRYKVKSGTLYSFSEQELVDCDTRKNGGGDLGCNGGLMDTAFDWATQNGGLCLESAYPYTSGTTKTAGTCTDSKCTKYAKPSGHVDVTKNSDSALSAAIDAGVVSVAIEADQASFQLYKSGVFTGTCGTNLDHGVLAVGYGTDGSLQYYKVKNSWGSSWGESGYIRIQKGKSQTGGQCGILMGPPSYPKY